MEDCNQDGTNDAAPPHPTKLASEMADVRYAWDEVFSGEFEIKEVFNLITELVQVAEVVLAGVTGDNKHEAVREVFDMFNAKYDIVGHIDRMIKLPLILEPFDGAAIRKIIDFLIMQAVSAMNGATRPRPVIDC